MRRSLRGVLPNFVNCLYTEGVKSIRIAAILPLIALTFLAVGCKSNDLNNESNAEKDKEQTAVDKRADAISKVSDQAASPGTSQ
jgi:hypothetical protein